MISLPPFVPPAAFSTASAALAQVQHIYASGCAHLRDALLAYIDSAGDAPEPTRRVRIARAQDGRIAALELLWANGQVARYPRADARPQ